MTEQGGGPARFVGRNIAYAVWGLGLLALLLTYVGVKDKHTVAAQVPYLVSGGLLSVALAALGAALVIRGDSRPADEVEQLKAKMDDLAELVTLEVDLLRREIAGIGRNADVASIRPAERTRA